MKAILVLIDSLNREFLKAYDSEAWAITPNLDAFAEDSIKFDKHFVGSAPCMPARRDMMTGRLNFLERNWGPLEPFDHCMTRIMRQNGIFSHIVTDHAHYMEPGGEGYLQGFQTWDYVRGQEWDPWVSRVTPAPMPEEYYGQFFAEYQWNRTRFHSDADFPSPICFQNASQWLRDNQGEDNFFLQIEVFSPHEPFHAPKEFLDLYGDDYDGPPFETSTYREVTEPPEAIEHLRKKYASGLTMVDKWFGRLIDTVKEMGIYDDTLIIVTTDHGHLLGEHGYTGKNYMHQYNQIANIPLFIRMPGCGRKRVDEITQNIDLMPTLLEYFGIPVPERVQGVSLLPMLEGKEGCGRKFALYGTFGGPVNLFDGRYTYHRAPVDETNSPLYYYTSMPVTLMKYLGVDCEEQMEMGRFLKHTDFPVYKIPARFPIMQLKSTKPFQDTLLFDWEKDWAQEQALASDGLQREMERKLTEAMEWAQSPEDQYIRLGLRGAGGRR